MTAFHTHTLAPGHFLLSCDGHGEARWFDPSWRQQHAVQQGEALGRGNSQILRIGDTTVVLRHYLRGGIIARLNRDKYLWQGLKDTRPYRELTLLLKLRDMGLSVPNPVAGRVLRRGFWYTADIMTEYIADSLTLDQWLMSRQISMDLWQRIGATIATFHRAGLDHVDLNIRNILIDSHKQVYLIDFDRCQLRDPDSHWQHGNLERLSRSLYKLGHYTPWQWQQLMHGYRQPASLHRT
ncbi:3-deoxy-D-manno-octulosonic acid kinase [Desulfurispirillum indicum]|uniref:3-deoxy-D-manno-octulosonic acid kinase n=1 Tax=Desulfurispirillum indicum (strain ATCC BAA-1389 / DSM 22839 / S5) TaxID=653733 RepID=E6W3G7_DESIS|nr:3-deoxy-D-manno-octulosonic acid kinase [Desulfurispirillum indicum]ADU65760.1 3-deoxy-D-manno-octulosonic-acid kinase [Desulfurispirillum indicum S5]UCZ57692.1 3-deoxy-D-manno-octulosonic acid kinase [Desulfurispirillum indicum]